MSVETAPPILPEVSLASPFRWIGEFQRLNPQYTFTAARTLWRESAKTQFRQVLGFLDAEKWGEAVDGLDDDTVSACLERTESVLKLAMKESR